jgi:hypothetical protein
MRRLKVTVFVLLTGTIIAALAARFIDQRPPPEARSIIGEPAKADRSDPWSREQDR